LNLETIINYREAVSQAEKKRKKENISVFGGFTREVKSVFLFFSLSTTEQQQTDRQLP